MKVKKLHILLFFLLFSIVSSAGIPDSLIYHLDLENESEQPIKITGKRKISLFQKFPNWLFFHDDQLNYKNNNLNDSGYILPNQHQNTGFTLNLGESVEFPENFEGKGWYKCYFRVPHGKEKKIYGMYASLHGAAEIYYDGNLIKTIGKIDSKGNSIQELNVSGIHSSFYVEDTSIHCIAIRFAFSNFETLLKKYKKGIQSPAFEFTDPDISAENISALSIFYSITNMISAFFFALFIIHLLIYFFYREKTFNVLYSLFLFLLSLSFLELYILRYIEDLKVYMWVNNADNIIFPIVCFLLVTLLNKLLNEKPTWHYKGFAILLVVLILNVFFVRKFAGLMSTTIVFYTYFNTLAHSIKGIRRKVASARFLGWGILSFTLSFVLLILSTIVFSLLSVKAANSGPAMYFYTFLLILSVLSIPLSMSAYLAYDFARTNSSLSLQLKQNQELNAKSLLQEKEKQELLANQNKMLETQVHERTKEIAEQNKLLEHQKKEITDSITYAKRIQQALLPDIDDIKKKLPNSFILYLPKDIVSGDFYFFQSVENNVQHPGREGILNENGIYIAAADCTGHGVPGALMSMIVHEKLEAATKIYNHPKDILKSINKQVKDALKQYQNEGSSRDGCDIAFLKITDKNISYSGAYRPLYYFAQDCSFHEIKATKTAIAGLTPYNQEFEQHELNLGNIKALYMFSDGFADQFGGEKIKKLTTKKFKELLSTIYTLPVNEQKERLESFFKSWKGNVEQIDDVLIIGILF